MPRYANGYTVCFVIQAYYVVSKTARKHGDQIAHQADTSRNTLEKHEADAPVRFCSSGTSAPDRMLMGRPLIVQNPAPWPENRQNVDRAESVKTYTVRSHSSSPCFILLASFSLAALQILPPYHSTNTALIMVHFKGGRLFKSVNAG